MLEKLIDLLKKLRNRPESVGSLEISVCDNVESGWNSCALAPREANKWTSEADFG